MLFKKKRQPESTIQDGLLPAPREIPVTQVATFDAELQTRIMSKALFRVRYDGFTEDCIKLVSHFLPNETLLGEIDLFDNVFKSNHSTTHYWAIHIKSYPTNKRGYYAGEFIHNYPYEEFRVNPFMEWELISPSDMRRNLIMGCHDKQIVLMILTAKCEYGSEWQDWHYNGYPEKVIRISHPYIIKSPTYAGANIRA